ncbi:MAG: hypothetical protein ACI9BF_000759 [Candidatus Paceibacteria bacterium]|jgi:hypothetical protein
MEKKLIILISSALFFLLLTIYENTAPKGVCDTYSIFLCNYSMYQIVNIKNIFGIVLFFSLLTYKLPVRVFNAWWKFARFTVPTIFALVILINLGFHHNDGGFFNMDADFDRLYVNFLYIIFIIGSLIQIVRGYRK